MANIINRYYRYENAGMQDISKWFNVNGINTVFPRHYIYHAPTNALYNYTPWKSNIYIRQVNNAKGLYNNLNF